MRHQQVADRPACNFQQVAQSLPFDDGHRRRECLRVEDGDEQGCSCENTEQHHAAERKSQLRLVIDQALNGYSIALHPREAREVVHRHRIEQESHIDDRKRPGSMEIASRLDAEVMRNQCSDRERRCSGDKEAHHVRCAEADDCPPILDVLSRSVAPGLTVRTSVGVEQRGHQRRDRRLGEDDEDETRKTPSVHGSKADGRARDRRREIDCRDLADPSEPLQLGYPKSRNERKGNRGTRQPELGRVGRRAEQPERQRLAAKPDGGRGGEPMQHGNEEERASHPGDRVGVSRFERDPACAARVAAERGQRRTGARNGRQNAQ